ncbi:serine protease, partial ['Bonamia sp.' little leaf phytoplasma]|nr:serine protease ['Bonamia sp.' little leaf phytoplasma]
MKIAKINIMNIFRITKKNYLLISVYSLILIVFALYYYNFKQKLISNNKISVKYADSNNNIINKENKKKYQIIEDIQNNLKNIFDKQKPINHNNFKKMQKLKKYDFHKGEIVYGFTLDIDDNIKPFQEGIISEEYNQNRSNDLSI